MRLILTAMFAMSSTAVLAADMTRSVEPPATPTYQASDGLKGGGSGAPAAPGGEAAGPATSCSHRSSSHVSIGSLDLDMMRCQSEKLSILFAQSSLQLVKDAASIAMMQADLDDAQAQIAELKKKAVATPPAPPAKPAQ